MGGGRELARGDDRRLELLIFPVIYVAWRKRELPDQTEEEAPLIPPALVVSRENRQRVLRWIALIVAAFTLFYASNFVWQKIRPHRISSAPFASQAVNDLTVNFIHPLGQVRRGNNEFLIEFQDAQGQLVDVGNVKFDMDMNMPGMQMHSGGTIERTNTPGRYRAKIKIDMFGDWNAKISFDGPQGQGQQTFPVTVK